MKNSKEQIIKNQHIVPQRHLKNFLAKNSIKLECLNIDELRIEKPQSPKSICKKKFHYALTPGEYDEYSQRVEKAFGYIETWYGDNINRIKELLIAGRVLSDDDRYNISTVIANFYFRGCKHREEVKKASINLVNWAFPNNQDAKKIATKTSHATNSSFDIGHVNTLAHKHWKILINRSSIHPFITSDEAVIEIRNNSIPKFFIFSRSFLHRTQIFHLSSEIAIITLFPITEETHRKTEFLNITKRESAIAGNNLQYINHANKYVYASNKVFFEEVIDFNKNKDKKF